MKLSDCIFSEKDIKQLKDYRERQKDRSITKMENLLTTRKNSADSLVVMPLRKNFAISPALIFNSPNIRIF